MNNMMASSAIACNEQILDTNIHWITRETEGSQKETKVLKINLRVKMRREMTSFVVSSSTSFLAFYLSASPAPSSSMTQFIAIIED